MINKIILFVVGLLIGLFLGLYFTKGISSNINFNNINDSLNITINELKNELKQKDNSIYIFKQYDSLQITEINKLISEKEKIKKEAYVSSRNPHLYNSDTLSKFFNNRYKNNDTSKIILFKLPLIKAAQDLITCNGTKIELMISDSIIVKLNKRINIKDSIITLHEDKDSINIKIISTDSIKYNVLNNEYKTEKKRNKKLTKYIGGISTITAILLIILIIK
jgi:hypothetical protein